MNRLILGIKRHPKRFFIALFFGYVTLWTFLEPLFTILALKIESYNWAYLGGYSIISLLISGISVFPKRKIAFDLKNTNTKVEILFGDLFEQEGNKVISANDYFDTEIGTPVSNRSLHGHFISKVIGNHTDIIDNAITTQLSDISPVHAPKSEGKQEKSPLGTTIHIDFDSTRYFLFALAESDVNCKAFSTPAKMLNSLDGLWFKVRNNGNGNHINLPLVGNGLSGVGIYPTHLIQIILISLLKFVKTHEISTTVRIILREDVFEKIDLELIKNNWQ